MAPPPALSLGEGLGAYPSVYNISLLLICEQHCCKYQNKQMHHNHCLLLRYFRITHLFLFDTTHYLLVAVVPVVHFKLPTALRAVDDKSCVNDFIDENAAAEAACAEAAVDAAKAAAF